MRITKRMMSLLLAVCVAVTMLMVYAPTKAWAASFDSSWTEFSLDKLKYDDKNNYRFESGKYYLNDDVTLDTLKYNFIVDNNAHVTIDLNGYKLVLGNLWPIYIGGCGEGSGFNGI